VLSLLNLAVSAWDAWYFLLDTHPVIKIKAVPAAANDMLSLAFMEVVLSIEYLISITYLKFSAMIFCDIHHTQSKHTLSPNYQDIRMLITFF
jgi:hypothetical protein